MFYCLLWIPTPNLSREGEGGEWCLTFLWSQLSCNTIYPETTSNLRWRAQSDKITPPPTSILGASCKFRLSPMLLTNLIQIRGPYGLFLVFDEFPTVAYRIQKNILLSRSLVHCGKIQLRNSQMEEIHKTRCGEQAWNFYVPWPHHYPWNFHFLSNLKLSEHEPSGFWWRLHYTGMNGYIISHWL